MVRKFSLSKEELELVRKIVNEWPELARAIVVLWAKANGYRMVKAQP